MSLEIKTQITINASSESVWKVFTKFEEFPEWNTFVKSLKGNVNVGGIIEVDLPGMKFKPQVLAFDRNKELRWKGKLIFKGLFDGEHQFMLQENPDASTTFHHNEKFTGLLVPLFKKKLMTETKQGFESMNQALKKRVESKIKK